MPPLSSNAGSRRSDRAQSLFLAEDEVPEFFGAWIACYVAFLARIHVDAIDFLPSGGVGMANRHFLRVFFCLRYAFGIWKAPAFGFNDGDFRIAVG